MELSHYRALVTVVQAGSFTRAAELLRTQKPRISRQIKEMESELGVRLLERTTRRLHLTEVGREVYERSLRLLEVDEDTRRVAQAVHAEPIGVLRLTMPLDFGQLMGFRWVTAVLDRHPQLSIEVDSSARVLDLLHEGMDLAIRLGPLPDSSLAARRLGELHYGLYASPDYLRRRGAPKTPEALSDHAIIAFAPAGRHAPLKLRSLDGAEASLDPAPRLRVDSRMAQRDAALAGLGVCECPRLLAAADVAAGRLQPVLPGWARPPVPVHAVFPSARFLTPKVRAFVDHALQDFSGQGKVARDP